MISSVSLRTEKSNCLPICCFYLTLHCVVNADQPRRPSACWTNRLLGHIQWNPGRSMLGPQIPILPTSEEAACFIHLPPKEDCPEGPFCLVSHLIPFNFLRLEITNYHSCLHRPSLVSKCLHRWNLFGIFTLFPFYR